MACRSSRACNTVTTSASVTPAGACSAIVWLNWSTGPPALSTPRSQRMIGVAVIAPVPSSTTPSSPSAATATRASRATVCSVKMSRVRTARPAARARVTTCIEEMLSPPRSKNESSAPTRSTPRTWA